MCIYGERAQLLLLYSVSNKIIILLCSKCLYVVYHLFATCRWSRWYCLHFLQMRKLRLQELHWFVLGHTACTWWHWGLEPGASWLSSCSPSLLCHSAYFTTPNCLITTCRNQEGSLGESWDGVGLPQNINETYTRASGKEVFLPLSLLFVLSWNACVILASKTQTKTQALCSRPKVWRQNQWDQ